MNNLKELLKQLKWETAKTLIELTESDDYGKNNQLIPFLEKAFKEEWTFRQNRATAIKIKTAGFPKLCTFEGYDFDFQPNLNINKIRNLMTLEFVENASNIIFIGTSGVGKTHLAISLGVKASEKKYSVYFIDCQKLINNLKVAKSKNELDKRIKHYAKYKLLIIDELGFLPIDSDDSKMFFQLVNSRYEKHSTIITTNKKFSEWSTTFKDESITQAIVDRLVHHSTVMEIKGKSYRARHALSEYNDNKYNK